MPNDELNKVLQRLNRQIGQKVKAGERSVARKFVEILAEIRALLAKLFEKYEIDGKLTWEELAKYDRFNKLISEINYILQTHYAGLHKIISEVLGDLYQAGYYMTAYGIEKAAEVKLAYSAVRSEVITAAATNPVTKLSPRLWAEFERQSLVRTIQQTVTRGLVEGSTYSTMAKSLKDDLGVATYKTMRVVRTEGHRVSEKAKLEAADYADKNGIITVKRWNTLQDERVRRTLTANHAELDGETIPVGDLFRNKGHKALGPSMFGVAEEDINCRCFLTYEVVDIQRRQHDDLAELTFEEWQKTRLKH